MKTKMLGLMLLSFAGTALAVDRAELDNRIRTLTAKFEALQQDPGKRVPAEDLRKANGIVLLDRTKAGFLFAYQGGSGVAMVKDGKTGQWSPVGFLAANEASLGFQIGGEHSFVVMLFMDTRSPRWLTAHAVRFGGEAQGTAGEASAGVEAAPEEPSVLVCDSRQGLYGGVTIKGGAIEPDAAANCAYYRQALTMSDILFDHKVKPTEAASALASRIIDGSKQAKN